MSGDKLARLVEGFAHALRNPLFSAKLDLHTLRSSLRLLAENEASESGFVAQAEHCARQIDRAEELIAELVEFACPLEPTIERCCVQEELTEALVQWRSFHGPDAASVEESVDRPLWAAFESPRLTPLLLDLFKAAWHGGRTSALQIEVGERDEWVMCRIRNPEWSDDNVDASTVFEPFMRLGGEDARLRLTIAKRDVERAGGQLSCQIHPAGGASFDLALRAWYEEEILDKEMCYGPSKNRSRC